MSDKLEKMQALIAPYLYLTGSNPSPTPLQTARLMRGLADLSERVIWNGQAMRVEFVADVQQYKGYYIEIVPFGVVTSRSTDLIGMRGIRISLYQLPMHLPYEKKWAIGIATYEFQNENAVFKKSVFWNKIERYCVDNGILFGYVSIKFVN